jgi:hypothetical protein
MTKEQAIETKQSIVFAFYKDGKLKGFRQDTMGSVGAHAKIYSYSEDQVRTVLTNIFHNIEEIQKTTEEKVKEIAESVEDGNQMVVALKSIFAKSSNQLKDFGEFEVRVLPCPSKIDVFTYPDEAMLEWLSAPLPEPIEVHKFKV